MKVEAKISFLTDSSKSKMIQQSTMQNIMGQSFTHPRYKLFVSGIVCKKKGGGFFLEKYCPGSWHSPCERHRSKRGCGLSDEHNKPLLWIAHHVTKVQNLNFKSSQNYLCISNLFLGLVFFSTTRWTTSQRQTSRTTLESLQAPIISSGLEKIFSSCTYFFSF